MKEDLREELLSMLCFRLSRHALRHEGHDRHEGKLSIIALWPRPSSVKEDLREEMLSMLCI